MYFPITACLIEQAVCDLLQLFVVEVASLSDRALLRRGGGRRYEQTPPDGLLQEVGVKRIP